MLYSSFFTFPWPLTKVHFGLRLLYFVHLFLLLIGTRMVLLFVLKSLIFSLYAFCVHGKVNLSPAILSLQQSTYQWLPLGSDLHTAEKGFY